FCKAEDGIRDDLVTGVQTCALPIFVAGLGKVDPLDDRVPFAKGEVELRLLDVDRHARKRPVLSAVIEVQMAVHDRADRVRLELRDRKSTRLNSSHQIISYAAC